MNEALAELRQIKREVRQQKRRIERLSELRNAAIEAADAYAFACARVRILSTELARAKRRNDEERFVEITRELKLASAEAVRIERAEYRAIERFTRYLAKFNASARSSGTTGTS